VKIALRLKRFKKKFKQPNPTEIMVLLEKSQAFAQIGGGGICLTPRLVRLCLWYYVDYDDIPQYIGNGMGWIGL